MFNYNKTYAWESVDKSGDMSIHLQWGEICALYVLAFIKTMGKTLLYYLKLNLDEGHSAHFMQKLLRILFLFYVWVNSLHASIQGQ